MRLNLDFVHPQDASQIKAAHEKALLIKKTLGVQEYENAVLVPGQGEWNGACLENVEAAPLYPSAVYVGEFLPTWGHLITDHLRRFWFFWDERYAHFKNLPLVYTMHFEEDQLPANFYALLALLGIPESQLLRIRQPSLFKRLFVPDVCFRVKNAKKNHSNSKEDFCIQMMLAECHYTQEYISLIERIGALGKALPDYEKVYFSRAQVARKTQFYYRRDVNEEAVEALFRQNGFRIVYPENLSFQEQLNILQSCRVFAATDGSVSHNLLFCKPCTSAIIVRKLRQFTPHQVAIHQIKNAEVVYIDAGFSPFADKRNYWWGGPFLMFASSHLCRFFQQKTPTFPLFQFLFIYCPLVFLRQGVSAFLNKPKLLKIKNKLKSTWLFKKFFKNPRST